MLKVDIGSKAPDFCLPNKEGQNICLKDFENKWLVIYFYPKDNTKSCTIEAIDFTSKLSDFEKLGAFVIGISPDSPKSHQKFTEKHDLQVLLLSDEEKKVLEEYGVWQEKTMYGKQYMGVVRSTIILSPDKKVVALWEKVRVKNHVETVLQRLKELQR